MSGPKRTVGGKTVKIADHVIKAVDTFFEGDGEAQEIAKRLMKNKGADGKEIPFSIRLESTLQSLTNSLERNLKS